jgi:hypothetical protein
MIHTETEMQMLATKHVTNVNSYKKMNTFTQEFVPFYIIFFI